MNCTRADCGVAIEHPAHGESARCRQIGCNRKWPHPEEEMCRQKSRGYPEGLMSGAAIQAEQEAGRLPTRTRAGRQHAAAAFHEMAQAALDEDDAPEAPAWAPPVSEPFLPRLIEMDGDLWVGMPDGSRVQLTKSSTVRRDAWQCPRCHRINAPFAQQCSCTGVEQ